MKLKEYVRLGKISIKSRKKSTKNTVLGICFGLIIIIPVLFFSLSFYIGLKGEVNKVKTVSTFHITSRNQYDKLPSSVENAKNPYNSFTMLDYKSANSFTKDSNVKESIASEFYVISGMDGRDGGNLTLSIGDKNAQTVYKPTRDDNYYNNYNNVFPSRLKVIHMPDSGKYILDSELYDIKQSYGQESIFSFGNGFSADTLGKSEIIVSEKFCSVFLEQNGDSQNQMSPQDILGKDVTFTFDGATNVHADSIVYQIKEAGDNPGEQKQRICNYIQNFKIVGIVSNNYYKLPGTAYDAHVWVSSKSVYNDDFESIAPNLKFVPNENSDPTMGERSYYQVDYNTTIAQLEYSALAEGKMAMEFGALQLAMYENPNSGIRVLQYMTADDYVQIPPLDTKIQCASYDNAVALSNKIDSKLMEIMPSREGYVSNFYANNLFTQFSMLNTVGGYIMIVMYAFGGIIFFATMLNLYNSVNYSVQVRKNYMGVMRAIGAKSSMIPKLYFWEILLIFLRALPWVFIIGGAISFGIKLLIDMGFEYIAATLGMTITLNFAYFFIALAVVVLVVFVIALAFSQIASAYAARRPILDVLSDDKG